MNDEELVKKNLRGIILAGGKGTRLEPLTRIMNKHLVRVGNYPMIEYPLQTLIKMGIKDILVISGVHHIGQIMDYLGSGKQHGAEFTYRVQDEAGGIAQALALAEDWAQGKKTAVILGDNIFLQDFKEDALRFVKGTEGTMLFLKEVMHPQRFGVATVDNDKITGIIEKPKEPKTNLAVTGLYLYDSTVFNRIKPLKPSGRGELEITDVNMSYVKDGKTTYKIINQWIDAGTFPSLEEAEKQVREHNK